jgi:Sortase domain
MVQVMYHPIQSPFRSKPKRLTIRSLRYKIYIFVLVVFMLPILVASNANTSNDITFVGYDEVSKNPLYSKITKNETLTIGSLVDDFANSQVFTAQIVAQNTGLNISDVEKTLEKEMLNNKTRSLNSIIPKPQNPQLKEFLIYPEYNINVPLVYSRLQDFFESDSNGNLKRDSNNQFIPIVENKDEVAKGNYESVPVQKLLKNGVVHTAYSVNPGEVGNSYIVGHSSNFSSVQSPYNYIFKPLEKRSKVGEEFIIYDKDGRELKFKVFEVLEIQAEDTKTAYKDFGDRRIVTLQTSILDANFQPTKRWLTRGELVI